jgi:hypothetical protein
MYLLEIMNFKFSKRILFQKKLFFQEINKNLNHQQEDLKIRNN